MTIFNFALKRGLRSPLSLIFNALVPVVIILIRGLWVDGSLIGFGLVTMAMMTGAFLMAQGILKDKEDGAIIRILTAPVTMVNYFGQNLLACMVPLMGQVILLSMIGFVNYEWTLTFTLALALCYTLFNMASVSFAFAWHSFFKSSENSNNGFMAIVMFIALLSGVMLPVYSLPGILEYVGAIFPAYWVSMSLRALKEYELGVDEFMMYQMILLLFSAAYLLYAGKRRLI